MNSIWLYHCNQIYAFVGYNGSSQFLILHHQSQNYKTSDMLISLLVIYISVLHILIDFKNYK